MLKTNKKLTVGLSEFIIRSPDLGTGQKAVEPWLWGTTSVSPYVNVLTLIYS